MNIFYFMVHNIKVLATCTCTCIKIICMHEEGPNGFKQETHCWLY